MSRRRRWLSLLAATTITTGLVGGSPALAATPVSETVHVEMGFTTTIPISEAEIDDVAGISWEFSIQGEAQLTVDLGADITMTYDREDLTPGGTVPVEVVYQPTDDPGPEFDLFVSGDVVADVDVSAGTYIAACLPGSPLNPLCPLLGALDAIGGDLDDFTLNAAAGDFVAPLGADAPVAIPGTGNEATLSFAGVVDLISAEIVSTTTLGPVGSGAFPGLGGAATVATASNATVSGGEVPGVADVLEWQAAGSSQAVTLQLPADPTAPVGLDLSPIYHWLAASANIGIDLDFEGVFGSVLPDPGTITVFNDSLGQIFVDNGVDVAIGNAVQAAIGFDPGFQPRVAAGNLPVPLTDPAIGEIPPVPTLGGVSFMIGLDADGDGLLDGEELAIGTDPDNPDTDGDGLTDGEEVETYGTDPLDDDTDDDGLTDGDEVNVHGTDPLDDDTDDDGLTDGTEVAFGTDPLDEDTDNDGVPDGQDVEFIQNALLSLADDSFNGIGNRQALLSILDSAEKSVVKGKQAQAIKKLSNVRDRLDGCGTAPDTNDWIVDCDDQTVIRDLLDLLISNLAP
jgi:hypothetical protein